MCPQSNSSSMGVHNGSAYEESGSSHPAGAGDSQHFNHFSQPSAVTYNQQNANAHASDPTSTHRESNTAEHHSDVQITSGHDYFTVYERVTPRYDTQLIFEDDHANTASGSGTQSNTAYIQRAPAQDQNHQRTQPNGAHSPTTERWSIEQSPEERLRLGLSRYPTEEEQRMAYESRRGQ